MSRLAPADLYTCERGTTGLVLSIPHSGLRLPEHVARCMTPAAQRLPDTDWRVDELYDFAAGLGATVLTANYSRCVVDLNRPPGGDSLYPGRTVTGLCPTRRFDGEPIYRNGCEPDAEEIERRCIAYWQPYHDRLEAELTNACQRFGHAILYDCHSIAPVLPRLFEGRLAPLNLGTNGGSSCASAIQEAVVRELAGSGYRYAVNGRFIGGFITRHHGRPELGRHALQMEIAQDAYMDGASPETWNRIKTAALKSCLQRILLAMLACDPGIGPGVGTGNKSPAG